MFYFFMVLSGLISGIFGGMGMGGGTVLIPVLTIFLGVDQKVAQGLNLFAFLLMAIVAIYLHNRNGLIVTKNISYIIISGVLFCVLGAFLMSFVPSEILKIVFGVFLVCLSVLEFAKVLKK